MSVNTQVTLFKWISILEGLSFLLLLFIAMPLKYLFEMPTMVQQVGMAHGVLFIAYIIGCILLIRPMDWTYKQVGIIMGCSLIPFGPFYVDKKYL
ncbi:DUF3817 domain-containing protein [Christiangramia salexigens]|uniref:DUF3817 domain-containing protein n=1 Tax=Christiangramia salexigens TaxID=1913577 RepID=A0A1L3J3A0_9FLAO|nr:DUF3817 domain-containing protein [Christiangramia salexigens]APG59611.1 hypothetical protein LPB144_03935 [Christiangramia salexigens]